MPTAVAAKILRVFYVMFIIFATSTHFSLHKILEMRYFDDNRWLDTTCQY